MSDQRQHLKLKDADEEEVFEIEDFTTASNWEIFTAAVEEVLHEWKLTESRTLQSLSKAQLSSAEWQEKSTSITFADFPFRITYHFAIIQNNDTLEQVTNPQPHSDEEQLPIFLADFMSFDNDFPAKAHCLVRWYGVREFVILTPANHAEPILSPSKGKLLLSSLTIAANNTSCQVPLFVQMLKPHEKLHLGVALGPGVRTDFDMIHFAKTPPQCFHLAGLLDLFREKLNVSLATVSPILVSVRLTYVLTNWPSSMWMQQPPDFDAIMSDVGFLEYGSLPFGALSDPIDELHISATWPCMDQDMLVDSTVYSDLDPISAPKWTCRVRSTARPLCLLSEYLTEYAEICQNDRSAASILGSAFDGDGGTNFQMAFDRLTEPAVPTISSVVGNVRRRRKGANRAAPDGGPIDSAALVPLLNFLFPDAEGDDPTAPYPEVLSQLPVWSTTIDDTTENSLKNHLNNTKASGVDGLIWRLTHVICHAIHSLGGVAAAAHLWHEFVLELRFRWENSILVPGISSGNPDLASCLLQQKLQMLNCCIQRRNGREMEAMKLQDDVEDEEEFFDCDESDTSENDVEYHHSAWDAPEGRRHHCGTLRLLATRAPLYVPWTQDPAPMTEDRLEEHSELLLQLGDDAEGSHLRAKMMSSSLLSDMEAFKAANAGSELADFVRWYSPRDWLKREEGDVGSLSARMQVEGNMWQEVWGNAKPVPARRQKRLFDEGREAEEVLQWLSSLTPGAACCLMLPVLLHGAVCRVSKERFLYTLPAPFTAALPQPLHSRSLSAILVVIAQRLVRLSRQPPDIAKYVEVMEQMAEIETAISCAQSLHSKLVPEGDLKDVSHMEELVLQLLSTSEVVLEGGSRGVAANAIVNLFQKWQNSSKMTLVDGAEHDSTLPSPVNRKSASCLGLPSGREFILRCNSPFPNPFSRPFPHRLYAVVMPNEFRMAGAFTHDLIF